MVKMEITFKKGLSVSDLSRLNNMIKKCGGEGFFIKDKPKRDTMTGEWGAGKETMTAEEVIEFLNKRGLIILKEVDNA